ncbi:hypothetical protein [Woodsholea maritima]|uniref:hypothetical protein n=1 Tax=Woodsholea maritima TaxID=240237 RepID=UPI000379AC8B|nr:hypothetical protein [Woodsholea maritima]
MAEILNNKAARLVRHLIVYLLAGLLIVFHIYTLIDVYALGAGAEMSRFEHGQSILRAMIATSLIFVVLGQRKALWVMWLSIGALVASQIWAHMGGLEVSFVEGRHPLSYLKGLIFPTIITLAFPPSKTRENTQQDVQDA